MLGVRSGASVVDITDAPSLKEVAFVPNPSGNSAAMDIKTYRQYAYVANDDAGGINIIDLSALPASASLATTYAGIAHTHNIYIDTAAALLYAQHDGDKSVIVLSLANPLEPVAIDTFGVQCHDIFARGNRAYVSEGTYGTFAIYDVSVLPHPILLGRVPLPVDGGYAHNAWLTEDGNFPMTTYETPGRTTKLWNISNPDSIYSVGEYLGPTAMAHNVHIKGSYAYISHYLDGLRIVNIVDKSDLSEVAFFDSYAPTGSGYHGTWGTFPFFASGKVVISDIETGLYVVRFPPSVTSVQEKGMSKEFVLHQNHPNPFNPETVIRYQLSEASVARLSIFDVLGRERAVLVDREEGPGSYNVRWDASAMPSGMYFYRLVAGGRSGTKQMVLIR